LSSLLKSQKVEREYIHGYDQTAEDLMKCYDKNNSQFFTLILKQEPIDRKKFEKTQFIITEYETYTPEVRREALKKMDEKYNRGYQWVHQLINRYYPEQKANRKSGLENLIIILNACYKVFIRRLWKVY
jgi:hypothetical protein